MNNKINLFEYLFNNTDVHEKIIAKYTENLPKTILTDSFEGGYILNFKSLTEDNNIYFYSDGSMYEDTIKVKEFEVNEVKFKSITDKFGKQLYDKYMKPLIEV